jgi:energy-coupling factor transporter ATP-binding protein EcfA2
MSSFTLRARNFRKLEALSWSPSGVCLLAGPNGAGKTTTLDALVFLRTLFTRGHESAFIAVGGDHFRRWNAVRDELVEFEVVVEDLRWVVRLPMSGAGLTGTFGEELYRGSTLVLKASAFQETWYLGKESLPLDESRCCAKVLWDRGGSPWMAPLATLLSEIRTYDFWLNRVREGTSREERSAFLQSNGQNLWAVLANWKQAPRRYGDSFERVMREARAAFPDLIQDIDFDRGEAFIFPPHVTDPAAGLPPRRQADGLLTGLLQLTAIVGAKPGSVLAFDEVENQLHPHAIRLILSAMRTIAEERGLTIILTTHSPVVMNEFADQPDQLFVLQPGAESNPTALDQLKDPAWLAMFSLGELYDRMKFAAPPVRETLPVDEDGDEHEGR